MNQAATASLKILVVDDDEVDRMSVRRALKASDQSITVGEAADASSALKLLDDTSFDCAILDYRLPGTDGLRLLREIRALDMNLPVIMMTGQRDERLIVEIMKAGATDYLSKSGASSENLMLSIRNAIRVQRAEQQLRERTRQALLGADIGMILISTDPIQRKLERCAEAIVRHLDAAFARIWTLDEAADALELQASAGQYSHPDGEHSRIPVGQSRIGLIAQDRQPLLENDILQDAVADRAWAVPENIRACAGYPLVVQDKVVGVVAMFAPHPLSDAVAEALGSIADELALAIHQTRITLENERLYQQAQDAIHIREVFLSVASHELKTPLTSLMSNVQLFMHRATRENSLNERDSHTLSTIWDQAVRLNKFVGALLDISRLENGKLSIQREPMDLAVLVRRLVEETRPMLERHAIEFDDFPGPLPLLGDELRLEQVIQNLVQNAIKYSPQGGTIRVKLGIENERAVLYIIDQGIGIPPDAVPRLFDRFFRAPNAHDRNISGMGLGLYVVKEIVGLHDGTIDVSSAEGQGSTFSVRLPLTVHEGA